VRITDIKTAYKGWLTLFVATLRDDSGRTLVREIEDHGSGSAVLPYDPERRTALMVAIARAPCIRAGGPTELLEAPAGLIDPGESPLDCARREAFEETGVRLGDLEPIAEVFAMPGISTEVLHLFLAPYGQADRIGAGGGLAEENERLTVIELPLDSLWRDAQAGRIRDLKTLTLVLALQQRHSGLMS